MKKLLCIVLTIVLGISMFSVTSVFAASVTNDIPGTDSNVRFMLKTRLGLLRAAQSTAVLHM